ncbi:MAG: hypothetical protein J1F38_00730 [Muribaculaceae bacterium]|nr:hypothetical protein [Muribaculaceae bacterium]
MSILRKIGFSSNGLGKYSAVYILLFLMFPMALLPSCISDDITDSPSATLTFSTDTVNFGAIFTDLGTPTARLKVYNRNAKGVNISSIRLRNSESPFRLNVDGVSGDSFSDVEIRGNDSIYVFLECFIKADDSNEPFRIADQLEFVTNGVTQDVEIEAWGWNVTRLKSLTVEDDMILTSLRPYVIFDTLRVMPGATLKVEPGAWLLFHDKAQMEIQGSLLAIGEPGNFIRMSGDRLDDILPDVAYDQLAGQWGGLNFTQESFGNRMEYVNMRSTVSGLRVDSCGDLSKNKLTLVNCWLHNSQSNVLNSKYSAVDAYGCCFSEAAGSVVKLTGGLHNFVQCTIANAYLFASLHQPNLYLEHCLPENMEDNDQPLMTANFENGIVWGEIGDPLYPGELIGSNVFMLNMLFKANGSDDENFINCVWNEDPLYNTIREDYYFDYTLQPDSPAIGKGNPAYLNSESLYDMLGVYRLLNGLPALGAYAE